MTPTLVHRYAFPLKDAIETLLGDAVGDCEAWRIRVEGDEVVIDVVAPVPGIVPTMDDMTSLDVSQDVRKERSDDKGLATEADNECPEPQMKGDPLARRAAIACSEKTFQVFLDVPDKEAAAADVCRRCGITTRKMLDHDERAAALWRDIDGKYRLWLEGMDIEI